MPEFLRLDLNDRLAHEKMGAVMRAYTFDEIVTLTSVDEPPERRPAAAAMRT